MKTPAKDPAIVCWDCEYRRDFENSFLGICTWFEARGKGVNKAIPPALVDKGCKHGKKKSEILQE